MLDYGNSYSFEDSTNKSSVINSIDDSQINKEFNESNEEYKNDSENEKNDNFEVCSNDDGSNLKKRKNGNRHYLFILDNSWQQW